MATLVPAPGASLLFLRLTSHTLTFGPQYWPLLNKYTFGGEMHGAIEKYGRGCLTALSPSAKFTMS